MMMMMMLMMSLILLSLLRKSCPGTEDRGRIVDDPWAVRMTVAVVVVVDDGDGDSWRREEGMRKTVLGQQRMGMLAAVVVVWGRKDEKQQRTEQKRQMMMMTMTVMRMMIGRWNGMSVVDPCCCWSLSPMLDPSLHPTQLRLLLPCSELCSQNPSLGGAFPAGGGESKDVEGIPSQAVGFDAIPITPAVAVQEDAHRP